MKTVNIASHVKATKVVGSGEKKQVLVVVDAKSVKEFRNTVAAESDIRRTVRWNADRDFDNAVKNYVRWVADFHGKRLGGIKVVVATDKPDLFRDAAGRFLKI